MPALRFQFEPLRVVFAEPNFRDLISHHWHELGVTKEECPLDPDYDLFLRLADEGMFLAWTARDGKTLVGYIGWLVRPHIHYKSTLHATEDLFMLAPEYRKGLAGYRMWTTSLEALRERGVKRVFTHTKDHFQRERGGLRKFFTRLGFEATDTVWVKML